MFNDLSFKLNVIKDMFAVSPIIELTTKGYASDSFR
jgi:hypothetical protein